MKNFIKQVLYCGCETFDERRSYLPMVSLFTAISYITYFLLSSYLGTPFSPLLIKYYFSSFILVQLTFATSYILSKRFIFNPLLGLPNFALIFSATIFLTKSAFYQDHQSLWISLLVLSATISMFMTSIRCNLIIGLSTVLLPTLISNLHSEISTTEIILKLSPLYGIFLLSLFLTYRNTLFRKEVIQKYQDANRHKNDLRNLINSINKSSSVLQTNAKGVIFEVNDSFCKTFDYEREDLIGQNYEIFESWFDSPEHYRNIMNIIKSGNHWCGEICHQDQKGGKRWAFMALTPRLDQSGNISGFISLLNDISEQKEIEEQLQNQIKEEQKRTAHQAKLATIGELAAGVGHEINNPLTIANGQIRTLRRVLSENNIKDERSEMAIGAYQDASNRIKNIVKGLKSFSRMDSDDFEVFDLKEMTKSTINLVREIYSKEGIQISDHYPISKENTSIFGNQGKIQQVLMNLLSNAKDSLIEMHPKWDEKEKTIEVELECLNKELSLKVTDNGKGILDNDAPKIFDAFYTTKDRNKGTGIGLAISERIIKEHEGDISFESSKENTTFKVELPYAMKQKNKAIPRGEKTKKPRLEMRKIP